VARMLARDSLARRWLPVVAALPLLLTACGSSSTATSVRDQSNDVSFTACGGSVACTGSIDGAPYEIVMPSRWNGTLLLYSHGYRNAAPIPPDFAPVDTTAEPAPGWGGGDKQIGQALLDEGYAIAGSAYKSNGWAVSDGVGADEALYGFFKANIATPMRVYAWGDSLGGLITQTLAEEDPAWVNGAAPLCGALAGVVPNMNLALDVEYGIQQLLDPAMTVTGFASYSEAVKTWTTAMQKILAAAPNVAAKGPAKIAFVSALVHGPTQTQTYDGSTVTSKISALVEEVGTALGFGTFGRYDVEQRYGGNISGNETTNYAARISAADRAQIDAIGGAGTTDEFLRLLAAGHKVTADPAAVTKAQADGGDPQGTVQVPTITLHTAADPLVIVQNESWFKTKYQTAVAAGTAASELVQAYTVPPATYPQQPGAPYGAGHCNFTAKSRLAVISLLDNWVRNGVYPGPDAIAAALGPDSGYNALYQPGPWPAGNPT